MSLYLDKTAAKTTFLLPVSLFLSCWSCFFFTLPTFPSAEEADGIHLRKLLDYHWGQQSICVPLPTYPGPFVAGMAGMSSLPCNVRAKWGWRWCTSRISQRCTPTNWSNVEIQGKWWSPKWRSPVTCSQRNVRCRHGKKKNQGKKIK